MGALELLEKLSDKIVMVDRIGDAYTMENLKVMVVEEGISGMDVGMGKGKYGIFIYTPIVNGYLFREQCHEDRMGGKIKCQTK